MPNKYEKLTEPHKMISNIFANVNAGMEAGKNPVKHVIKEGSREHVTVWDSNGAHCSEPNCEVNMSKKPADKAIEDYEARFDKTRVEKKTSNKLLKAMLRDLKKEKVILKKSLSKAGELIEELKKENKLQKAQLRKFGQVFDNCGGKEVDAEFNEKEFNDYVNKKKGEQS